MRKLTLIVVTVFIVFAVTGFLSEGEANEIYGCYKKNNGQLRIVSDQSKCLPSELPISFSGGVEAFPRMWFGTHSNWTDHTVTTSPETFIEITINKEEGSSSLKMSFSGGRLSFMSDSYNTNLNSQVVFSISIDGQVVAESLNYDCCQAFRNQYPMMSTLIEGVSAGEHMISVAVSKTDNPGEGGDVTYTTTIGNDPNTYKANLIVEEWP